MRKFVSDASPRLRWLLVLSWTALIIFLLLRPGKPPPPGVHYTNRLDFSSVGHVITFCLLTFLWYWTLRTRFSIALAASVAIVIVLGIGTMGEFAQYFFVSNRGASIYDWLGNNLGMALALAAFHD